MTFATLFLLAAVAPGFPDWIGLQDSNVFLANPKSPQFLNTSDLRHKATIVIQVSNDATVADQLKQCATFASRGPGLPKIDWENTWDNVKEMPRNSVVLLSVVGKKPDSKFRKTLDTLAQESADWSAVPIYQNVTLVGEKIPQKKYPYVYVFEPSGADAVWQGTVSETNEADAVAAFKTALGKVDKNWTPITGVPEIRNFPAVAKQIAEGKYEAAKSALKVGIKNPDPAIATEAQIVYDAIEQYKSDIIRKISSEWEQAPETAYMDYLRVLKLFPSEKKKVQFIDKMVKAKGKDAKLLVLMGKALLATAEAEKASELKKGDVKKLQLELQKFLKQLNMLAEEANSAGANPPPQLPVVQGKTESALGALKDLLKK